MSYNPDYYKQWYQKNKDELIKKRKVYKNTPQEKLKNRVRALTKSAVKMGFLPKLPCQICNRKQVQAHHNDYSKPYEIWWLCQKHHTEIHTDKALYESALETLETIIGKPKECLDCKSPISYRNIRCKTCVRKRINEWRKQRYHTDPIFKAKVASATLNWYIANKERLQEPRREYAKSYYQQNKKKMIELSKQWRANNLEKSRAYHRAYWHMKKTRKNQ